MKTISVAILGITSVLGLFGCATDSSSSAGTGYGTPSIEEQACLRDVTRTTNNGDVVLVS